MDTTIKTIATHDGSFHCDEALAIFLLRLLPQFKDTTIVRTRNPALLETADIVVDVGAVYDPAKHRYDHHQREFVETMNSLDPKKKWTTKLSSAGLVYVHFGREVIRHVTQSEENLELLFDKMYESFIEEVDAVDNGINQFDGEPRYQISSTVGKRVGGLNPPWNSAVQDYDARFERAMQLVGGEFLDKLNYYHSVWLPARTIVQSSIADRFNVDPSGEIVVLQSQCPWKAHLFDIEGELGLDASNNIKYVLYTDEKGNWRVQCVSESESSFKNRLSLPEPWRGVRDDQLSAVSGIPDCIFVHTSGFIGGNKTQAGALAMARGGLQTKSA